MKVYDLQVTWGAFVWVYCLIATKLKLHEMIWVQAYAAFVRLCISFYFYLKTFSKMMPEINQVCYTGIVQPGEGCY